MNRVPPKQPTATAAKPPLNAGRTKAPPPVAAKPAAKPGAISGAKPAAPKAVASTGLAKGLAKKSSEPMSSSQKKHSAKDVAEAFAKGEVTLATAIGLTTEKKDAIKARAFDFLKEKRGDLALPLLEGLVALDPFYVWTLTALASLKIDRGAAPLAIKLLDRALEVRPGDVTAHALRFEARTATGDLDGAQADLKQPATASATHPAVRRARGLAH